MAGRRGGGVPAGARARRLGRARREWDTGWQRQLFEAGYAGINWPKEYGGRGATPTEHLIYFEESERARAPYVGVNFVGLLHGGPTLIAEGTPEQKERHLRGILRGDQVWCQGFSEPNAGSDLASLRTTSRPRRRPLRRQRPEDLDQLRPDRRVLRAARAHRPRRPQAQGHHVAHRADGPRRASTSGRSPRWRAPASSARCSSTTCACRSRTASATRTTAGASPT